MTAATVRVRVLDGWAVYDGKRQRGSGDLLDVAADAADAWVTAGWVERVSPPPRRTRR